jgi:CheY-like chemotaxis protein
VGIAAEELPGLFKTFSQTASGVREGSGTGLGLAISARYAGLMGGGLTVTSAVGVGSCFEVRVKLQRGVGADVPTRLNPQRVLGIQGAAVVRVLVVDDQAENRELIRELLKGKGFTIQEARDGVEALEQYNTWKPQLILLDMRMPKMDGYTVLRRIRAMEPVWWTRIVAVTASAFAEDQNRILELGADSYIRKPFREQELFEVIGRLLEIEYLYADQLPQEKTPQTADDSAWIKDWLAQQPVEWLTELRQAILTANLDHFYLLIDQAAPGSPEAADGIRELAGNFQYDQLLRILPLRTSAE